MKITVLVTIESPPTSAGRLEPFVVVYDLFKPEDAVEAIRRHVVGRFPVAGAAADAWSASRMGWTGTVRVYGPIAPGREVTVEAQVQVLTRFNRSNTCAQCDGRCLWSAFDTRSAGWATAGAEAVGCDECGWIVSDHPVAGRPSAPVLSDEVEVAGAQS